MNGLVTIDFVRDRKSSGALSFKKNSVRTYVSSKKISVPVIEKFLFLNFISSIPTRTFYFQELFTLSVLMGTYNVRTFLIKFTVHVSNRSY